MKTSLSTAPEANPALLDDWPGVLLRARQQVATSVAPLHSVQLPLQLGLGSLLLPSAPWEILYN